MALMLKSTRAFGARTVAPARAKVLVDDLLFGINIFITVMLGH